jgi:hypothetical protein
MARRRREAPATPGESTEAQLQTELGPEPQATLTVRGSARSVKEQLGISNDDTPTPKPEAPSQDDEKKKFVDALRNPKYIICVKRMTPREFNGQKTNVEVWRAELPLGYQEIQTEIAKDFGGEKYRVAVIDPASNNTIAADTFVVDGDPIIQETDVSQAEMDRMLMRGEPKSAADLTEEGLERRARLTAKQIEVEAYEEQLSEARKRREHGGKPVPQDNTRVDELERRLTEAKHQAELEARDRKHAEELKDLRTLIQQNARSAKPEGQSETALILAQMQKSQEAADKRFEALQRQMQDDKSNAILEELRALRNKPSGQGGSLLEQAEAMLKLRKIFGWGGSDSDEDEDDDEDDDRPWYEKALDKLGGKFGDKLLEKFTAMEEKGETVSREDFLRGMMEHADQVAAAAVKKQLPAAPAHILPAPPPPRPAQSLPPAPLTALPPPPPSAPQAGLPPPPASPAAAPVQVSQPPLTIEQEMVIRVGGVLEMIEREMELRPNEYLWNYEGAYNALPESVLEKVCAAPDPVAMIDGFLIPNISADALAGMKAKIAANPRILAWLKVGHDELKEWFAEKMKNPKFDPFADEGPEGEDE